MAAFNFPEWVGRKRAKLYALFNITSGHDHDGVNSKLVSVGTPTALSVTNASVAINAAIAYSKLAVLASGNILVGNGSNVATSVAVTGDVLISNAGVTSFNGSPIVNADINASAAIAWSKMAASGDINTSGQVVDLTIGSEAQGDILYRNATNWVRLAAGTAGQALVTAGAASNPYWGTPTVGASSALANSVTLEAGANDYTLIIGAAGGAYTLTIPAVGGSRTFSFIDEAQAFTAVQTFTNEGIHILDTNASHDLVLKAGSDLTADRILTITTGDAARTLSLGGDLTIAGSWTHTGAHTLGITTTNNTAITLPTSGTLATVNGALGTATATSINKVALTAPATGSTLTIADGKTLTANASLTLAGTDGKTLTLSNTMTLAAGADGQTFTFPTVGATVLTTDSTAALTNKTFDCDGTGNALSNVNANELDPITPGASTYAIPFVITYDLSNQAAAVDVFNANAPFKLQIIKAWSISTSADGGTWKLNNGAAGAGTDITNAVTVAANDQDYDEPTDYDDSAWEIAANGSLSIVPDGAGLLDCRIFIECIRID